jgi:hypothetical protein
VGDEVSSAPTSRSFKLIVFGADREGAELLSADVFGPSLSTALIGGAFAKQLVSIGDYISDSDTAELRRNPLFHEVQVALRTIAPIVVRGGIFDYTGENEAHLWLRVAEGEKVRVVTIKVTAETTASEIIDQVNSVL